MGGLGAKYYVHTWSMEYGIMGMILHRYIENGAICRLQERIPKFRNFFYGNTRQEYYLIIFVWE